MHPPGHPSLRSVVFPGRRPGKRVKEASRDRDRRLSGLQKLMVRISDLLFTARDFTHRTRSRTGWYRGGAGALYAQRAMHVTPAQRLVTLATGAGESSSPARPPTENSVPRLEGAI